jgi:hypothetical protein
MRPELMSENAPLRRRVPGDHEGPSYGKSGDGGGQGQSQIQREHIFDPYGWEPEYDMQQLYGARP